MTEGARPRVLLSYWYARTLDQQALQDACAAADADVILDSGAFSAFTTGADIRPEEFAAWLRLWSGKATAAFNLDVIGNPAASHRNYLAMRALDTGGIPIIPVFHAGGYVGWLDKMIDTGATYVAFGGLVEHFKKRQAVKRWAAWYLDHCRQAGVAVHGLGLTARAISDLPFYSVDSSSWTLGQRHGVLSLYNPPKRGIEQMKIRRPSDIRCYAGLLRAHRISIPRITAPDFLYASSPTYREDVEWVYETNAMAFHRYETYLRRTHRVVAPAGFANQDHGTKVYLAASRTEDIRRVFRAYRTYTEGTP